MVWAPPILFYGGSPTKKETWSKQYRPEMKYAFCRSQSFLGWLSSWFVSVDFCLIDKGFQALLDSISLIKLDRK